LADDTDKKRIDRRRGRSTLNGSNVLKIYKIKGLEIIEIEKK
jgi:hypothetical protein